MKLIVEMKKIKKMKKKLKNKKYNLNIRTINIYQ